LSDANPYASPVVAAFQASYKQEGLEVDTLAVSSKWKQRFHLIKGAGGIAEAGRGAVGFNVFAFFLGPLYYLAKGMWRKAFSLFGLVFAVSIGFDIILVLTHLPPGLGLLIGIGSAVFYALRANSDYYRKKVLNDNGWW
jgi:hypothetical protein